MVPPPSSPVDVESTGLLCCGTVIMLLCCVEVAVLGKVIVLCGGCCVGGMLSCCVEVAVLGECYRVVWRLLCLGNVIVLGGGCCVYEYIFLYLL